MASVSLAPENLEFVGATGRGWRQEAVGAAIFHSAGLSVRMPGFASRLAEAVGRGDQTAIDRLLRDELLFGAGVVIVNGFLLAFVDHIRSRPLFFHRSDQARVSPDARSLLGERGSLDPVAALEFEMAGYVTGGDTLMREIGQLRAGERLLAGPGGVQLAQYYSYVSSYDDPRPEGALVDELLAVLDQAMRRVVTAAAGRPVWVPLSGGLDSRVIAAKLHELKCPNLHLFSYGPPGNWEARRARAVADAMGMPWFLLPTRTRDYRSFFRSPHRRDYWRFADTLCSLPNPQDVVPIATLLADGRMEPNAVVVNGQTGDFLTGGHILPTLRQDPPGWRTLFATITDKHLSLWRSMKTGANLDALADKAARLLGVDAAAAMSRTEMVSHFERWEYEERQAKFVVNGQRVYEFLGADWQLPLWDVDLVRFYQRVPMDQKVGQRLYRTALRRWNHAGVFPEHDATVWRWPGATMLALPLAKLIQLAAGKSAKESFYRRAAYYGHYRHFNAAYDRTLFWRHCDDARNVLALDARTWMIENGGLWGEDGGRSWMG